jgi:hypothetical protein
MSIFTSLSKKGDHVLLRRLIRVTEYRRPFVKQVVRYQRQRQWLFDLEALLDPTQPPTTTQAVTEAVVGYLEKLERYSQKVADPIDQQVIAHIGRTFRSFWWGLFVCYDVDDLPATNNELEQFIRQIKSGYRRISGRKKVHDFVIRYGAFAAFVDQSETEAQLLDRLQNVSQADFLAQRQALSFSLTREQTIYRFRHRRTAFLADLEQRWGAIFSQPVP